MDGKRIWKHVCNSDFHYIKKLNCWETLKAIELKRNDETSISVNVAKAEKIYCITYG
jgi:hypothetical protein